MIVTLVLGIWMLTLNWSGYSSQVWIWIKIILVVVLIGYHHYCLGIIKAFARGEVRHSERFFRIFNEVPVLILVSVVFLAVLKPFNSLSTAEVLMNRNPVFCANAARLSFHSWRRELTCSRLQGCRRRPDFF